MGALVTEDTATVSNQLRCDGGRMILSENSSTLGSRCCSAARSETEWQRNESWKVRLLELPPKLNMQACERRPPQVRAPCVRVVYTVTVDGAATESSISIGLDL